LQSSAVWPCFTASFLAAREAAVAAAIAAKFAAQLKGTPARAAARGERAAQVCLLRDLVRDPFRTAVPVDPSWMVPAVLAVARQVDEEQDFAALPVLADALEENGCVDVQLLRHCRSSGQPHTRGCWVLDLLLAKEERR
jgi:hypothetical protein